MAHPGNATAFGSLSQIVEPGGAASAAAGSGDPDRPTRGSSSSGSTPMSPRHAALTMAAAAAGAPFGGRPSRVYTRKEAWCSTAASHRRCS
eukprot:8950256-Alexandrium_andersonii.AAC.1